jgi:hypothetical protein
LATAFDRDADHLVRMCVHRGLQLVPFGDALAVHREDAIVVMDSGGLRRAVGSYRDGQASIGNVFPRADSPHRREEH